MNISQTTAKQMEQASWIRRMFEEGRRLRAERGTESVFDFSLGNPEIEPPVELKRVLQRLVVEPGPGRHAYMPTPGFPDVREAIAEHLHKRIGLGYTAGHVLMSVGAAGAINTVLRAVVDPGDEVIVLVPYFVEYRFYPENFGGRVVFVETDERFQPDIDRIERALTSRTKAILVNSPNNPTGVIYEAARLEKLGAMLGRLDHPAIVISDEPYRSLTFDGKSCPDVARLVPNTVIATSWSKSLAIAGERIGYVAISPRIPGGQELHSACCFAMRALGFVNAPGLWQRVVAEVAGVTVDIAPYQAKRDLFYDHLSRIGYELVRPDGAFFLFPRTPDPDDVRFIHKLKDEGILAVPGSAFGRPGHMRLALTVSEDTIERSIPGFERVFNDACDRSRP